jgi:hypothetical protein
MLMLSSRPSNLVPTTSLRWTLLSKERLDPVEIAAWEMPFGVMVALILGCQLLSRAKRLGSSTTTMYSCNNLFSGLALLVEDI